MRTVAKIFGWFIKIFMSKERKDVITETVFMEPATHLPKKRVEYCIVLGGDTKRARLAAKLYHEDRIKNIVVSGGLGFLSENYHGLTEAEVYYRILVDHGVSPRDIIIEAKSRNTEENLRFSVMEIIIHLGDKTGHRIDRLSEVAIITSDFHMRRALLLARAFYPLTKFYYASADSGGANRDTWYKTGWGCFVLYKEYKRLLELT